MSDEEAPAVYSFVLPDGTTRQGSEGYTGSATTTYINSDKYEGNFTNGVRDGAGVYTFRNGSVFKGSYTDNKRNGLGTLTFKSGAYYHGNFVLGMRDGQGTYRYANGDVYVGSWSNNKKTGRGQYIFADSHSRLEGEWKDDQLVSDGSWRLLGGQKYTGDFKTNKPCGKGSWLLPTGDIITGTYSLHYAPVDFAPDDKNHPPTAITATWRSI